jgi:hypothetical protein
VPDKLQTYLCSHNHSVTPNDSTILSGEGISVSRGTSQWNIVWKDMNEFVFQD